MNIVEQKEELCYCIGETVINFQKLEYHLTEFLYILLDIKHQKQHLVLMDALSFSQKLNLVSEIFTKKRDSLGYIKVDFDFETARKCISKAEEFRNKIVHSFYYLDSSEEQFKKQKTNIRGKNGLKIKTTNIDFNVIKECNKELNKLVFWYFNDSESLKNSYKVFEKFNQF